MVFVKLSQNPKVFETLRDTIKIPRNSYSVIEQNITEVILLKDNNFLNVSESKYLNWFRDICKKLRLLCSTVVYGWIAKVGGRLLTKNLQKFIFNVKIMSNIFFHIKS